MFTTAPFWTCILVSVPALGATISFSIFMASRMMTTSPALTVCPAEKRTSLMLPGSGESTVPAPAEAAGALAAGLSYTAQAEREVQFNANFAQAALTLALRLNKERETWQKLS